MSRPFVKAGRTLYPTVRRREEQIRDVMAAGLTRLADRAGL